MIIDFTVENFLSIRDEQVFSMYAESEQDRHTDNIAYINEKIGVLKTACLFGANASGKTNLIHAFKAIRYLISSSGELKEGDEIPCYEPYLLSPEKKNGDIKIEIEFYVDKNRFRYQISYNKFEVNYELLEYFPGPKPAKLFERNGPSDWKTEEGLNFGSHYKGGKKRFSFFPSNLYLSKAGGSPESPEIIRSVYNYFRNSWGFVSSEESIGVLKWQQDKKAMKTINCLIRNADLGIENVRFEPKELNKEQLDIIKNAPISVQNALKETWGIEPVFEHIDEDGNLIEFPENLESLGTRRLLDALPIILISLRDGDVLFCDEIESSFHSHVVELIIRLFHDPKVNINNAQLIFTTHSLNVMKSKTLRKDQVWLAEKLKGATEFSSLDQFGSSLRNSSPFDKWYDEGRLGGIPSINYQQISASISDLLENSTDA